MPQGQLCRSDLKQKKFLEFFRNSQKFLEFILLKLKRLGIKPNAGHRA